MTELLTTRELQPIIGRWVWQSEPISKVAAKTIASHWMTPHSELSAFVHGSGYDVIAIRHEIISEGNAHDCPVDLAALLAYFNYEKQCDCDGCTEGKDEEK